MQTQSKELQEYIQSSIEAIKNAVQGTGFEVSNAIEFSLAVTNTSEAGGGVKIFVAKADGKLTSEEISHIKFSVQPTVERVAHVFRSPHHDSMK